MLSSRGNASEIAFGTSGLRGPAEGFTSERVRAYTQAFLLHVVGDGPRHLFVGSDLRASSPEIVSNVFSAARGCGWTATYAGAVPTPALASFAMAKNAPAIMVTGSHIPESHNGLKFYRRDGELRKEDEAPMRAHAESVLEATVEAREGILPETDPAIARANVARYVDVFATNALAGLRVGVDQHSAVGRDLLVEILEHLGADCFPYNRAKTFIAVDTEALDAAQLEMALAQIRANNLDAVVSTDGDGDRPLVLDETGAQINGDLLGALTARHLGIRTVVTPLSSTSAIEQSGWFEKVVRTRIGSPYVVAAMDEAGSAPVAGFEANGGFLLGSDIDLPGGQLTRLPTRDALLPILAVLQIAAHDHRRLSALAADLPPRFMKADRVQEVSAEAADLFLTTLQSDAVARAEINERLTALVATDTLDGVRMTLVDGAIVHFRQSGNAPEMRCYVETASANETGNLLSDIIRSLKAYFADKG